MTELEKAYNPIGIEEKWYSEWQNKNYFSPDTSNGKPYSIVIPPPNVTGSLHMGHAVNATMQDILIRWKRMLGYKALWVPGTDHAGIATQNVVERELAKHGINRHNLGREEFIRRVWEWKAEYGGRIIHQLKKLGASCDWSRERFTLDDGLSKAVREVFVRLYEEGLIYRDKRLINWCPRCHTALSDIEVEHEELDGILTYIKYPLSDNSNYIIVATTRPETMLGDTAVVVNPEDERYKQFIGKTIKLPLTDREIPVLSDAVVDMAFGTGAVKVTPAHDFNDEAIARRQTPNLPFIAVIDEYGRMTEAAGKGYTGLDRYECRKKVVHELSNAGLLEKEEKHKHSVGHCYRCKTIIEPLSTLQWYVKVKPLADEAIKAVRNGAVKIIPETWENTYFSWMENIKDWCISRQIWWGHRIPVWYCDECAEVNVERETPAACKKCGGTRLRQDEDVLDTWFSSALWPFSTLGWPDKTDALKAFYPTSVLVTGFDILFFWVARMLMMGLKFMGEAPFKDVYIHALVRDSKGQKMSKSKGNVVDPLIMIEKYGADAFRFSLAAFAAQGRDIRFAEDRVEGYRFFVNKLWNATRFIMMNLNTEDNSNAPAAGYDYSNLSSTVQDISNKWILSRLSKTAAEVNRTLEDYRFNDAANSIYQFVWHEFCDWYIEMSKHALYTESEKKSETMATLLYVLDNSLRLLHPFMPFVTEEIWQGMEGYFNMDSASLMKAGYPVSLPIFPEAEADMFLITEAVTGIRNIRGEMNISPAAEVRVIFRTFTKKAEEILKENLPLISRLARAKDISIGGNAEKPKGSATAVKDSFEIYAPLEGLLNLSAEIDRLLKEKKKIEESMGLINRKLSNEDFLKRAPDDIIEKERSKHEELLARDKRLAASLIMLREVGTGNE